MLFKIIFINQKIGICFNIRIPVPLLFSRTCKSEAFNMVFHNYT